MRNSDSHYLVCEADEGESRDWVLGDLVGDSGGLDGGGKDLRAG